MRTLKKTIALASTLALAGGVVGGASPTFAQELPKSPLENFKVNNKKSDTSPVDIRAVVRNGLDLLDKKEGTRGFPYGRSYYIHLNTYSQKLDSVIEEGDPVFSDGPSEFVGSSILTNNGDIEQTLTTNSYSKQTTNSVTTTTTNGWEAGMEVSAEIPIDFFKIGMKMSGKVNGTQGKSITSSENITYTATPQNIKVAPHSSVQVTVKLKHAKATGYLKYRAYNDGYLVNTDSRPYAAPVLPGKPNLWLGEFINYLKKYEDIPGVEVSPNERGVYTFGSGKYEADYGSTFEVTVTPIQKGASHTPNTKKEQLNNKIYKFEVNAQVTGH